MYFDINSINKAFLYSEIKLNFEIKLKIHSQKYFEVVILL